MVGRGPAEVHGGRGRGQGSGGGEEEEEEGRGTEETYRYGEALRQRNTEERIIAGSQLPSVVRPSSLRPSSLRAHLPRRSPARRSHYLLLEETFCSEHSVILRIARSPAITTNRLTTRPRIRDSRHLARVQHARRARTITASCSRDGMCEHMYYVFIYATPILCDTATKRTKSKISRPSCNSSLEQ